MTDHAKLAEAKAAGDTFPMTGASKKQFLSLFAHLYAGKTDEKLHFGAIYHTVKDVEYLDAKTLNATTTVGTALQPAVDALNARGYNTDPNVGSFMRTTKLNQSEIHDIACFCHSGEEVRGDVLAARFTRLENAEG